MKTNFYPLSIMSMFEIRENQYNTFRFMVFKDAKYVDQFRTKEDAEKYIKKNSKKSQRN